MTDIIVIAVVIAVIGLAAAYVIRQKKRGVKCIGCPGSKSCRGGCNRCGK